MDPRLATSRMTAERFVHNGFTSFPSFLIGNPPLTSHKKNERIQ